MHRSQSIARARPLTRLGALVVVVLAAALAGPFMSTASANESASCNRTQFPTTCTITEPDVQQSVKGYPQIQLFAGQHVYVEAGGCVQTGGNGLTWKRYVNPVAANRQLYHGLIAIPGATNGFVRLSGVVNTTLLVPEDTNLNLGYEDDGWLNSTNDGYGDNGYWGRVGDDGTRDDGTNNQCRNLGNAWIHLTITN